jgi:hypothetical protein
LVVVVNETHWDVLQAVEETRKAKDDEEKGRMEIAGCSDCAMACPREVRIQFNDARGLLVSPSFSRLLLPLSFSRRYAD